MDSVIPKIQDYAMIGNGRSAALISRQGSLDWLSWPRFDSPSLFCGILDHKIGGAWKISPTLPALIERKYIDETNVLQTTFRTDSGTLILTDFMTAFSEEEKQRSLQPEHELIRRVQCELGIVEVAIHFDPRPEYGRSNAKLFDGGTLGLRIEIEQQLFTLRSDVNFALEESDGAFARVTLKEGEMIDFSLSYTLEGPAVLAPLGELISYKLALTVEWWQNWARLVQYKGPYRNAVVRSALALKLTGYAPSGAFVAAPTTSLPERLGGDFNWDYRYCWLRDAAFTVRALFGLGYLEEAEAFVSWLLHSTRLTLPQLRVLYNVFGEDSGKEEVLTHLRGYSNSRPVRIGNGVHNQFQLDVYGEVVAAVAHLFKKGEKIDSETQKMLRHFGEYVCHHWHEPDCGIWEKGEKLEHYTYSRLMCWVTLDRLIEMQIQGLLSDIPTKKFEENRTLIRQEIDEKGWNLKLNSYTSILNGNLLDACLFNLAFYGFEKASSARMKETYQRIQERLHAGAGLIYRYEQSPKDGEGAFAICCFWNAEFLALGGGTLEEAHQAFRQTLSYASDIGLFAEEIDPRTGDALGNFPQAFTHVGLINAALSLTEREEREKS